jgi:hypothetical protein
VKNALTVKCPECGAKPGVKCKNYKGKNCAPHSARNTSAWWEEQKINKPTHSYIGRKLCGCVVAVCVDAGDTITANEVAEFIKSGLKVERVPFGTPEYEAIINNLGCVHKKSEPQMALFQ